MRRGPTTTTATTTLVVGALYSVVVAAAVVIRCYRSAAHLNTHTHTHRSAGTQCLLYMVVYNVQCTCIHIRACIYSKIQDRSQRRRQTAEKGAQVEDTIK